MWWSMGRAGNLWQWNPVHGDCPLCNKLHHLQAHSRDMCFNRSVMEGVLLEAINNNNNNNYSAVTIDAFNTYITQNQMKLQLAALSLVHLLQMECFLHLHLWSPLLQHRLQNSKRKTGAVLIALFHSALMEKINSVLQ